MADPAVAGLPAWVRLIDDQHLGQPHVIGTYLLLGAEPALVDPGPASTLPSLEAGLAAHGFQLADVRALLLTHIHLDHAGASGTLVTRYPQLQVYVHQRGAPHLVAPDKLIASASRLYGADMQRLWGEILPLPQQNVHVLQGGETLRLGQHSLRVFDAPGHASHHLVYLEQHEGLAFVGDVAGVRMPGSGYARPPTPPPDIDIEAWCQTLDTLERLDPRMLLLTHFGPVHEPLEHTVQFRARLLRWSEAVRAGLQSGADEASQLAGLRELAAAELAQLPAEEQALFQQATPIEQSWQGLARYWRKRM